MSETLDVTANELDTLYYKLSAFSAEQATYKVLDALGKYEQRKPEIRCSQLLERLGMKESVPFKRLLQPVDTFAQFNKAYTSFRSAASILPTVEAFSKQLSAAIDLLDNASVDELPKSQGMVDVHTTTTQIWQLTTTGIQSARTVRDNLLSGPDFCALDWVTLLEKKKDERLAFSSAATDGFSKGLDAASRESWDDVRRQYTTSNDRPYLRYRTDTAWHRSHDDSEDYRFASRCNCEKLSSYSKWAWDAWNGSRPNIDGKGPEQVFCVLGSFYGHYKQCPFSEVLGQLVTGFETWWLLSEARGTGWVAHKAEWDDKKKEVQYDFGNVKSAHPEIQDVVKILQASRALCYEWATQAVIKEQWRYLSRAIPYLTLVRETQAACVEPMKRLCSALEEYASLAQELDYCVQEIPGLKLCFGSEFLIKCMQTDMVMKLTRMHEIWNSINGNQTTLKITKPAVNVFDFFKEYVLTTEIDDTIPYSKHPSENNRPYPDTSYIPYHRKWPGPQTPGKYTFRPIPFPYPRAIPHYILPGIASADFGNQEDIYFSVPTVQNITTTGFEVDIDCLDHSKAEAHGLGISWVDIPSQVGMWSGMGSLRFEGSSNEFKKAVRQNIKWPDWIKKEGDGPVGLKPRPGTQVACWVTGMRLEPKFDYSVSFSVRDMEAVEAKAEGSTDLTLFELNYFFWDNRYANVFCKHFSTRETLLNKRHHEERIDFSGKFQTRPRFFWALTNFNMWSGDNARFSTELRELTKDHAIVVMKTWGESKVPSLGFVCLALPDVVGLY